MTTQYTLSRIPRPYRMHPGRKYLRRTRRRRRGYKRYPFQLPTLRNNVNTGIGFPKKITMTHRFNTTGTLTGTTGAIATQVFNCNSLFEPVSGVSTHQPLYFDQMTGFYDHYTVIGSKIIIKVVPTQSTQVPILFSCYIGDDSTITATDISTFAEYSNGSPPQLLAQTQSTQMVVSRKWSARKYFGKGVLANNSLRAAINASPSELSTYVFGMQALDRATTAAVYINVQIQYIAVWTELHDGTPS